MASTRYDFESGTHGNTVTGFTAVESPVKYNNVFPAHGLMGAAITGTAPGTATGTMRHALASEAKVELVAYVRLTAAVTTDVDVLRISFTGDISSAVFKILNTGFARLVTTGSGVATTRGTDSVAFPIGSQVRVGIYVEAGSSATTGKARLALFPGDSTTAQYDTGLISSIDTAGTTAALVNARVGKLSSGAYTGNLHVDDVFVRTGADATGTFAPVGNVAPTVDAGVNQNVAAAATVNLSATAADSDGTIASHAWTYDYPVSGGPTLTGGTTATPSFTAGSAGALYILRDTVTDNQGATAFDTVEVRVSDSGTITPLPTAATGGYTEVGAATTDGAALADADDTTYLESATLSTTAQTMRIRLEPSTSRSGFDISVRLAKTDAGAATCKVRLMQGTTMRQEWTDVVLTTTITTFTRSLSGAAIAAITDWGDLWIEVDGLS